MTTEYEKDLEIGPYFNVMGVGLSVGLSTGEGLVFSTTTGASVVVAGSAIQSITINPLDVFSPDPNDHVIDFPHSFQVGIGTPPGFNIDGVPIAASLQRDVETNALTATEGFGAKDWLEVGAYEAVSDSVRPIDPVLLERNAIETNEAIDSWRRDSANIEHLTAAEYDAEYGPPKYATVDGHNVHGNLVRDGSGNMVPETRIVMSPAGPQSVWVGATDYPEATDLTSQYTARSALTLMSPRNRPQRH